MNQPKAIIYLLAVFLSYCSLPLTAQVNLKTGYSISFLNNPGLDHVITTFNGVKGYISPFSRLKWIQGIEIGMRLKLNVHAFEFTYQGGYNQLRAKGDPMDGTATYTDRMRFGIKTAALGYQVSGQWVGAGADLQYQWYRTKVQLTDRETPFTDEQRLMAMRYYLQFTFRGHGGIDLAVQPYIVVPFDFFNLQPLQDYLYENGPAAQEKWTRFGVTVLFYNGRE